MVTATNRPVISKIQVTNCQRAVKGHKIQGVRLSVPDTISSSFSSPYL
jgi:hypothetical protein